jgi:hypothetical protein
MAYVDLDIYGAENPSGEPKQLFDDDCIGNSIVMWLTSKRGDIIMEPAEGGVLDSVLFKNMSDLNHEMLVFKIQTEILLNFSNLINLTGINLIPNYTERFLEINISYQIISSKKDKVATLYIDTAIKSEKFIYENVLYTGQNLESFVLVTKSTMTGKTLQWNFTEDCWAWGRYKFLNFSNTDVYYSRILSLCNNIV